MSNMGFKNTWEMTTSEIYTYVAELEARIKNADKGATIWKEEAQLTRTELLKWREIAGQADDKFVEMALFFERHIEALSAVAQHGYNCAIEQSDFVTIVRLLRSMISAVLDNHRRTFMGEQPEPVEQDDWLDIPF